MLKLFKSNITELASPAGYNKYLLAISGGIDSMVMAQLFLEAGFKHAIAHCNFRLRGDESDGDEDFVRQYAKRYNLPFFHKRADTGKYAKKHKLSIQMAAREIRYEWLRGIAAEHEYGFICIAHNSNDSVETFFINLLRGTGLSGLMGISPTGTGAARKNEIRVIRPLLSFSRDEIQTYAKSRDLKWREDSSNATDKYLRNRIRHHLLPLLEEMQPSALQAILATMENIKAAETVYAKTISHVLGQVMKKAKGKIYFDKAGLLKLEERSLYLYEAIKEYGYNYAQAKAISKALYGIPGKIFLSDSHRLTSDRKKLIIEKRNDTATEKMFSISKVIDKAETGSYTITFAMKRKSPAFKVPPAPSKAYLDYDRLEFPLVLRRWKNGDKFYPLGMKESKKVSDLLIDLKVPLPDKEQVYVLLSGRNIAWVAGIRIDNRYKITTATKRMFVCELKNKS